MNALAAFFSWIMAECHRIVPNHWADIFIFTAITKVTGRDGTVHFPRYSFSDYLEQCEFVIGRLVSLLESLQEKGVYDSSLIIVYADHGAMPENAPPHDVTPKAFPFLWVKPANDTHAFSFSPLPTSHAKIHDLVLSNFNRNLTNDEVTTLLFQGKRLFYPVFNRICRETIVLDEQRDQIGEK